MNSIDSCTCSNNHFQKVLCKSVKYLKGLFKGSLSSRNTSRNTSLNTSFYRGLITCVALLGIATVPTYANAADYTLYIEDGFLTINGDGGAIIDVWGYTDVNGAPPMVPGPIIEARQGQTISIEVVNNHNRSHNFVIQGVTTDTGSIAAGGRKTYTITPNKGGVFFYRDTLSSNVNREMGMHGALIVRSNSNNRVWDNGPSYNIERLWVLADMDVPRWNNRAAAGSTVSTGTYRPNYFMINGQGGFDGMRDPNTVLQGNVGQVGAVRIVNAGQFDESLHWHGNHFQVISRNGTHLSNFEWQDTINVKAGQTMMVLYQLRTGTFPMHVHTSQMETANGVYLNGTATLIVGN